jgi:hypothetical protein
MSGVDEARWAPARRVVCNDGWSISVQGHWGAYCEPRLTNASEYTSVECGFPSAHEPALDSWSDDPGDPTGTVYGYVPDTVVRAVINKHGGIHHGQLPPLVCDSKWTPGGAA